MIYPNTDPKAWSLKHNIKLTASECRKCGKEVDVNIPIISNDFVGFESEAHECGTGYKIILLKPRSPEMVSLMNGEKE